MVSSAPWSDRAGNCLGCSKDTLARAGAAGGIGQPLALLLKGSKLVGELSLYDIVGTEGVAADLSHIDSSVKVALPHLANSLSTCGKLSSTITSVPGMS